MLCVYLFRHAGVSSFPENVALFCNSTIIQNVPLLVNTGAAKIQKSLEVWKFGRFEELMPKPSSTTGLTSRIALETLEALEALETLEALDAFRQNSHRLIASSRLLQ